MKSEIRWCEDIGMFATDRDIKMSCKWRTKACIDCYNHKLYKLYPNMNGKDERNEAYWKVLDGEVFEKHISKKRKQTEFFRFQTRGETFATIEDAYKVLHILRSNPDIKFWIPTRAWRNTEIKNYIETYITPLENAFVQASTDIYTMDYEWANLKSSGWSTLFYGDNEMTETPNGDEMFKCPKTFKKLKGVCVGCEGCFSQERNDVILKQH